MQLTVENVTTAKTGKSLRVKANGSWYGAKKDSGITAGTTIEAEVEHGDFGAWINKWKPVNGSAAPQESQPKGAAGVAGHVAPSPAGAAPVWLPFASNTVAHAINAGIITAPNMVEAWTRAAKEAFMKVAAE